MISIIPCLNGMKRNNVLEVCNASFSSDLGRELLFSYPAGFDPSFRINDTQMLIYNERMDYYIYDFIFDKVSENTVFEQDVNRYRGVNWYVEKTNNKKSTSVVSAVSGKKIKVDGNFKYVTLEAEGYVVLANRKELMCVSLVGGIVWKAKKPGIKCFDSVDDCLLFYSQNHEEWTTTLTFVELETGEVRRQVTLGYNANIHAINGACITLLGSRRVDEKSYTAFIYYHVDTGKVEEILVQDPKEKSYLNVHSDTLGMFSSHENLAEVWKSSGEGSAYVGALNLRTGQEISKIYLPNVCFESSPGLRIANGECSAVGLSRAPWPAGYWQMVLWDEKDFFDPNPEVYEEPLMGAWERITQGNQSYYRVYVERNCENFFQLYRQISVALHQCGAIHGFHRGSEGKARDEDFSGRIICDVSNHPLADKEKLAIKHLCPFVENKLLENGFRSSIDPAEKIRVEPKFDGVPEAVMTPETDKTLPDCELDMGQFDGALALFQKMRECCPSRTSIIATDVESNTTYMDIFRVLARLCGVQNRITRVFSESAYEAENSVNLSFRFDGEEIKFQFRHSLKYLSEEFWEWSLSFFRNHATNNLIEVSDPDEPFMELLALHPEDLREAERAGLSLRVIVNALQKA